MNFFTGAPVSGPAQTFTTKSLANTGLALYALQIRNSSPPNGIIASYIFPLSPTSVTKEFTGMSMAYDVQGSPATGDPYGVHRVIDSYGNSPASFLIEGTTGWQYHSMDGFALTGIQSIAQIQSVLNQYAQTNAALQQQGNPTPCLLEYYDYFGNEFWEVVPIGRQSIRISNRRPLVYEYSFRFTGVRSVSSPIPQPSDPILTAFSTPASQAQSALSTQVGAATTNYTPTGTPGP